MTIIEKIRAEIERRKKEIHATVFNDEFDDLLRFLDTLEEPVCHYGDIPSYGRCAVCSAACSARIEEKSEKPIILDLEKKALNFGEEIGVPVSDNFMRIARHFYELGRTAK